MKRFFGVLVTVLVVGALAIAAGPKFYRAGLGGLIRQWRPEVEYVDRRIDIPIDTNAVYTDLKFVRAPTYLALDIEAETTDERCLHPDVLYVPGEWNSKAWWMAMTPYPATTPVEYEEPYIQCSDDGTTWAAPGSLTNPIVSKTTGHTLSDPCIMLDDGVMYYFYRDETTGKTIDIMCTTSSDGETWSTPVVVVDNAVATTVRSPTVRNVKGTYWMWCQDGTAGGSEVMTYRTARSPLGPYNSPANCTLTAAEKPWHTNVKLWGDKFVLLFSAMTTYDMYLGISTDGVNFDCQEIFDTDANGAWDDARSYQASAVFNPHERSADVFYGGQDGTDYFIGRGKLFFPPSAAYDTRPLAAMLNILGDCRGFWPFLEANGATAIVSDYSRYAHNLTGSKDIGSWDTAPVLRAPIHLLSFDGTDESLTIADDADFSFDGSTDTAFSVGCWVWMDSGETSGELITKYDTTGDDDREWRFHVTATRAFIFNQYDESANAYIGRKDATTWGVSKWLFVVATSNGDGQAVDSDTTIDIYVIDPSSPSGAAVDDTNSDTGTYVDMEDGGSAVFIGDRVVTGNLFDGKIALPFVTAKELSAAEVWALYQISKPLVVGQ